MSWALKRFLPKKYRRFVVSGAVSLIVILLSVSLFQLLVPAGDGSNVQLIDCVKGAPLSRAAADMQRRKVIRSAAALVWLARLKGDDGRIQAGAYQFNDGMKLSEMIRKMVAGEVYALRFAVPEGYSIYQIAELLDGRHIHPREEFLAACTDKALLKEFGIPGSSVEGYLFPATYNITPKMKPAETVRMMVRQFEKVCGSQISPIFMKRDSERHRLVTLASLVEKEAVDPKERAVIASVFFNRLKKGMRLQSDPTAVYGIRPFSGKVTGSDVHRISPYNTYIINGLPPGPIGNPGTGALQAVLSPQSTQYFYFVARNDGTHFFSTTLDQHNRAVTKYLKRKNRDSSSSSSVPGYKNDHPSFIGGR